MFLVPRRRKITAFTKLFALGSKNHGIYCVFWTAPRYLPSVHHVERNIFSMQKSQNPWKFQVSWEGRGGEVLKWTATSWIIRQQGRPPSPLLCKIKLKVAPTGATCRDITGILWSPADLQPLHGIVPLFGQLHPAAHGQTSITCQGRWTSPSYSWLPHPICFH